MSAVSELIKVKYKDLTNYTEAPGGDVLGSPIDYYWGPVNQLMTLNEREFFETFPEELPNISTGVQAKQFFAYANIKKAFSNGIRVVEVVRPQGNWAFWGLNIPNGSTTTTIPTGGSATQQQFPTDIAGLAFRIVGKCPGVPNPSAINGADSIGVSIYVPENGYRFTIYVYGIYNLGTTDPGRPSILDGTNGNYYAPKANTDTIFENVLEVWNVSLDPKDTVDGESIFVETVLQKSEFITAKVYNPTVPLAATSEPNVSTGTYNLLQVCYMPTETVSGVVQSTLVNKAASVSTFAAVLQSYDDTMLSDSTLVISPVSDASLDEQVVNLGAIRQDLNPIIGFSLTSTFDEEGILNKVRSLKAIGAGANTKFSFFVAGREEYSVMGMKIILNCVGGWCGATAAIAESVRTNQLASAFSYGAYNGELTETLSFESVQKCMKEGVISVFSSARGPIIWGTRSLHPRQMSYFGKANVMRVLAKILRRVFPVCLDAVHTDAAANPVTRGNYQTMFSDIVQDEVSAENLINDSYADCGANVNTDKATKGGTIFLLNLSLHFIGLVESVNITVFATDSSVTAEVNN